MLRLALKLYRQVPSMTDIRRKKSPRAPSIPLDEALERAMRAYDKERLHPSPTDVVAQNLGYKGSSSGTALSALASLRYYGLLERPREGLLAVTKDVEAYKFAPTDLLKRSFLVNFLRRPALFAELLDKYSTGLPSDATLKYDLIQRGFLPASAASLVAVFQRSVDYTQFYQHGDVVEVDEVERGMDSPIEAAEPRPSLQALPPKAPPAPSLSMDDGELDRIPVRLPGGRRAWLSIPTPFYAADKERLKAQIDLLLTDEDETEDGSK